MVKNIFATASLIACLIPASFLLAAESSVTVTVVIPECSDGLDNDGDGTIDFPADIGCSSYDDYYEYYPPPAVPNNPVSPGGVGYTGSPSPSTRSTSVFGGLTFVGKADPDSKVILMKGSDILATVMAGKTGAFRLDLDKMASGIHMFKIYSENALGSKSAVVPLTIPVSASMNTIVSDIVVPSIIKTPLSVVEISKTNKPISAADINRDGSVNAVDFSILAYWYGKASPPKNADLNGNGKIDLVDFSILSYYYNKRP